MSDNPEEQYLMDALRILREDYAKAAKPYVDRLVAIRSMRIEPMYIPIESLSQEFLDASLKE